MKRVVIVLVVLLCLTGQAFAWSYVVQPGDSLYNLSIRYKTTIATIKSFNRLSGDEIRIGQVLQLPDQSAGGGTTVPGGGTWTYAIQPGDTLYLLAQRYRTTVTVLRQINNIWTDMLYVGQRIQIPGGYSPQDLDLLARLVTAEALGEPYDGLVAVAAVILHRVASPDYPNSIKEVIYQVVDTYYYQFSPVMDGRINTAAHPTARKAVEDAVAGRDPSRGAIGFYNPTKTTNRWVASRPVTVKIGQHVFFK